MDATEMISDVADALGGNILAAICLMTATAGAGRIVGGAAASAGVSPFWSAIIAAA
ncbi:MAG: hypothetical protein CM15mV68_390 [uncultured marine virus]|nr:MAG: hypothetical protein CM15mV68_390 [uncultured marine virus]